MTLQERIDAAVAGGDYTLACMLATEFENPIDHLQAMIRIHTASRNTNSQPKESPCSNS